MTDQPRNEIADILPPFPGLSDAQFHAAPRLVMPTVLYQTLIVKVEDRAALDRLLQGHPIEVTRDCGNGVYVARRKPIGDENEAPATVPTTTTTTRETR